MYVLEVSYGCPSKQYPLNGIFQMDQAKALFELNHFVVFAAVDIRSILKWRRWGITKHTENSIPVFEFNFPIGPLPYSLKYKVSKIGFKFIYRRIVKQYGKPDIVHAHFLDTAHSVQKLCEIEEIPYVVTEHSSGINKDVLQENIISMMKEVYSSASAVIAVSKELARRINCYTGIRANVVPNIIDLSIFDYRKTIHSEVWFVAAGVLDVRKGFDLLIESFAECIQHGMNANLMILGDGSYRDQFVKQAQEYGLVVSNRIVFGGMYTREQFSEALSKCDVFVLPSRRETFGVVYAEALACGVPVIATRCGGPEDFVNKSNGILIDVDNKCQLINSLWSMYEKYPLYDREKISMNARKMFSAKTIGLQISEVFNDVMNVDSTLQNS